MNIQINNNCPIPVLNYNDYVCVARTWYPDLKIKDNCIDDIKRITRKMIKERSPFLYVHFIFFNVSIPIFLYEELNRIMNKKICTFINVDIDNISFETNLKFNSKDELSLSNLFKKVKSSLKELEIPSWDNMKYFLPGSTIINTSLELSYIEIFEFLSKIPDKFNSKLFDFGNLMFKLLNEKYPEIFNENNIEIYATTKEIL